VLLDAARTLSAQPEALQLRYLQTLTEVANDRTTTVVFPLPMDMIDSFLKKD
jgi:regulator of protease activity HflC (stomatin/prohibitin superfamily)